MVLSYANSALLSSNGTGQRASAEHLAVKMSVKDSQKGATGRNVQARRARIRGKATVALAIGVALAFTACSSSQLKSTEPVAPASSPTVEPLSFGVAAGSGNKVTDARGEYERLTLPEDSTAYAYDASLNDASVAELGFTDADADSAQKYAMQFALEQVLDSSALDTGPDGYSKWLAEEAPKYFNNDIVTKAETDVGNDIIVSNKRPGEIPELIRDGRPRASKVALSVTRIYADSYDGSNFIAVEAEYSIDYRASDEAVLKLGEEVQGVPRDQIRDSFEEQVFDGEGENTYRSYGTITVGLSKADGDTWISNGIGTFFYYEADYAR
jgi:hypothetical protein